MSTRIDQVIIQMGRTTDPSDAQFFHKNCEKGDWVEWKINFSFPFPNDHVRVIVTPNDQGIDHGLDYAAAVGVVRNVNKYGFILAARNSACNEGSASFNWMAIQETPEARQESQIDLRMGILQQRYFKPDCVYGDWQYWNNLLFTEPLPSTPVVLLTACNLNVRNHNAAVVGIASEVSNSGFTLAARNSDCAEGNSSFYYLALTESRNGRKDLWIESGELWPRNFAPDCEEGNNHDDWNGWEVYFNKPFQTPPLVFVTANNLGLTQGNNPAVVGTAVDVTTHGFSLSARNSDCAGGSAGFYWVAIGCAPGCA